MAFKVVCLSMGCVCVRWCCRFPRATFSSRDIVKRQPTSRRIIDNESAINSKKRMSTKPPNYSFQFPFFCNTKSFFCYCAEQIFITDTKQNKKWWYFRSPFLCFYSTFSLGEKKIYRQIFLSPSLVPLSFCDLFEYNGHDLPQTLFSFG